MTEYGQQQQQQQQQQQFDVHAPLPPGEDYVVQQSIRPDMPPYMMKNTSYSSYSFASPHIDANSAYNQHPPLPPPPPPPTTAAAAAVRGAVVTLTEPTPHPSYYPSPAALAQRVSKLSLLGTDAAAKPSVGYLEFDDPRINNNNNNMNNTTQMSFEQLSRMVSSSVALTRFSLREMGSRKMKQLLSRDVGGFAEGIASFDSSRILTTVGKN